MSTQDQQMNDQQLDAALDALQPPVPSDTLVRRVHDMAPAAQKVFMTPRRAAAAALVMAIGAATMLQMTTSGSVAPMATPASPSPIAAIADPAGEIPVSDLELGGESTGPAETFSVAGMPLE
ncbi:MAG: hypothetical protein ACI9JL_004333 [Paracoccaceae bacterium]|jgi:hypothetical protein